MCDYLIGRGQPRGYVTDADYGTTGKYVQYIQRASLDSEPLLDRVLAGDSFKKRAFLALRNALPLHRFRDSALRTLDSAGLLAAGFDPKGVDAAKKEINDLFKLEHLRGGSFETGAKPLPAPAARFAERVDGSFLPPILDLAAKHGISTFFVRIQHRTQDDGTPYPQNAIVEQYGRDIGTYLAARGVGYRDLTLEPPFPVSWYGEGDHINDAHRDEHTRLLVELVPELFK